METIQTLLVELGCTDAEKEYVINREGTEKGIVISEGDCEVESCRGTGYVVQWADGELTECCTYGMSAIADNVWQIE